ncbi:MULTISPECIES: DUF6879 family protein [Streptomyces]|uniref:DUF6879 family protein n=1 Tax=Streptomyces TaxID=1883 RepID=UPI00349E9223
MARPLSEYERWECEWPCTATDGGQRTFMIDRSEVDAAPELPFDWWMVTPPPG